VKTIWLSLGVLSFAIMLGSISAVSNQAMTPSTSTVLRHADITFVLPADEGVNTIFRKRLIEFGATRQLRNGPVGLSGGVLGSPTYLVVILGSCDGAIDTVLPAIEYAASNLPLQADIISSYSSSAKCVEKEGREEAQ
jgi:hypothetical protein